MSRDTSRAMSQENVELVRPVYEAFNRRDWDALFRDFDPEFAFTYHNVGSHAGIRRGREEVVAFSEEYGGVFESLTWEPEEILERGDWVVAFVSVHSRPRGGEVDLVVRNGHLWKVRAGVILSLESFPDPKSALEAAETAQTESQDNVEAFKRGTEAYNRGDLDGLLNELDSEVEWHSALLIPFGGEATSSRGHEGVREVMREVNEVLAEIHLEYSEIRDLGDRIVGIGHIRTKGRQSGVVTEVPFGTVTDMKNGKGTRVWTYLDPQEALEAAGLSE